LAKSNWQDHGYHAVTRESGERLGVLWLRRFTAADDAN
jgi:hypothetical protein